MKVFVTDFLAIVCAILLTTVSAMMPACGSGGGDGGPTGPQGGSSCDFLEGTWTLGAVLVQASCPDYLVLGCLNPTGTITIHVEGSTMTVDIEGIGRIVGQVSCSNDSFTFQASQSDQAEGCTMNSTTMIIGTMTGSTRFDGTFTRTYSFAGSCGGLEGTNCQIVYQVTGTKIG